MGTRTRARVKVAGTIEPGKIPLFLLDGDVSTHTLDKAAQKLQLTAFLAICRPFDIGLRKRFEATWKLARGSCEINPDGSTPTWVHEHREQIIAIREEHGVDHGMKAIQGYLDYCEARDAYEAALSASTIIDATTGDNVVADLNEYLFERAKILFPLGIESIIETNVKQPGIPKAKFFDDGMSDAPPPKHLNPQKLSAVVETLKEYFAQRIEQNGKLQLTDIVSYCGKLGLYKSNITLYILGAACRYFLRNDAIFYDGIYGFRIADEVEAWSRGRIHRTPKLLTKDVSIASYLLALYDRNPRRVAESALCFDQTGLNERLASIFDVDPPDRRELNTLTGTRLSITHWVIDRLRYPIAFTDAMLHRLLYDDCLYGAKLREYDEYFTPERCAYIKKRLRRADNIARRAIQKVVGFDPDTREHAMSNLPKGHYMPALYSAEDYIHALRKEGGIWERINAKSASAKLQTIL
jgi:hypothetical protein